MCVCVYEREQYSAMEADPTHIPLVHWHQFADFRIVKIRYKNVRKSDTNERCGKQTVADVCPHPLPLNDLQFHPFKCQAVKYGSLVGLLFKKKIKNLSVQISYQRLQQLFH